MIQIVGGTLCSRYAFREARAGNPLGAGIAIVLYILVSYAI